jgi:hypothetical protein
MLGSCLRLMTPIRHKKHSAPQYVWTLVRLHDDDYSSGMRQVLAISAQNSRHRRPILPYSTIMFGMKSVIRNWVVHWGQRSAPFFTAKPVNAA